MSNEMVLQVGADNSRISASRAPGSSLADGRQMGAVCYGEATATSASPPPRHTGAGCSSPGQRGGAARRTPASGLQEWASFGDYVADVMTAFDAGRISEVEAEKRLVPAVVYQVRRLSLCLLFAPHLHRIAPRCAGRGLLLACPAPSPCCSGLTGLVQEPAGLRHLRTVREIQGVLRAFICMALPRPAPPLQTILSTIHIMHKPEVNRALVSHTRLPGEGDEAATARWRQIAVSRPAVPAAPAGTQPCVRLRHPLACAAVPPAGCRSSNNPSHCRPRANRCRCTVRAPPPGAD